MLGFFKGVIFHGASAWVLVVCLVGLPISLTLPYNNTLHNTSHNERGYNGHEIHIEERSLDHVISCKTIHGNNEGQPLNKKKIYTYIYFPNKTFY